MDPFFKVRVVDYLPVDLFLSSSPRLFTGFLLRFDFRKGKSYVAALFTLDGTDTTYVFISHVSPQIFVGVKIPKLISNLASLLLILIVQCCSRRHSSSPWNLEGPYRSLIHPSVELA